MYLLRHAATDANLSRPAKLLGRRLDPPLAQLGVRQAEATRNLLAIRPIDFCFSSPMLRAMQTASIVAAPHGLRPEVLDAITECDLGRWEGLDWPSIRARDPQGYRRFMADPAVFGYPGGESFADVCERVSRAIEELFTIYAGKSLLVIGHHVVNRTYLAGLLGLPPGQARQISLDTCGISVIVRDTATTSVATLNAAFHLQGLAAA
jgi:broad specificity phosphatase PhoE